MIALKSFPRGTRFFGGDFGTCGSPRNRAPAVGLELSFTLRPDASKLESTGSAARQWWRSALHAQSGASDETKGLGEIRISWDRAKIPLTGKQAAERLRNGQPRIVYYDDDEGGVLQARTMQEAEEILAARRLRQFFRDEAPLRA